MSAKKRAAVAAAISGTAGTAAGLAASHFGLDPHQSARIGAVVCGAAGNLLYQVFRLTPDDSDRNLKDTATSRADTATSDAAVSGIPNAPDTGLDTADTEWTTKVPTGTSSGADAAKAAPIKAGQRNRAEASDRKHPRHRKLERAARRRAERRQRDGRKESGHGAS